MSREQEEFLLERLGKVVAVRTRRMFGGVGIYAGESFFALIADDVLYLKVGDSNRPDYEAAGLQPFQPFADKPSTMSYYPLPEHVLGEARALKVWVEKSLAVARAKPGSSARSAAARKSSARTRSTQTPAPEKLANLGPASRRMLADVGVRTRADLEARGSVAVYLAVKARGHAASLNLLYALEGALLGLRWDRLPEVVKENLKQRASVR
jgi:DNA transformation protein and related proteins